MIGVSRDTLYDRCEKDLNTTFRQFRLQKRKHGENDIRLWQHRKAMGGDTLMLIWLGKQRLGQSDKAQVQFVDIILKDEID
jgi:hypothetical protein